MLSGLVSRIIEREEKETRKVRKKISQREEEESENGNTKKILEEKDFGKKGL